jgi:hypothetical protein
VRTNLALREPARPDHHVPHASTGHSPATAQAPQRASQQISPGVHVSIPQATLTDNPVYASHAASAHGSSAAVQRSQQHFRPTLQVIVPQYVIPAAALGGGSSAFGPGAVL